METKNLSEIIDFEKKSKLKASEGKKEGKYVFFTSSQTQDKFSNFDIYTGERIVVGTGGLPSIHYINNAFSCSTDCLVLKNNSDLFLTRYIYYFLYKNLTILERGFQGVGLEHISKEYLSKIKIPLLSIEKQKEIIEMYDKFEEINTKKEYNKVLFEKFLRSLYNEYFGNIINTNLPKEKLGELCEIRRGASPRPIEKYLGGKFHWIKIADGTKKNSLFIDETKETIDREGTLKSVKVKVGDLILANSGASLGFARILNIEGYVHDGWLIFGNINPKIDKIYLLITLNLLSEHFKNLAPDGTQPNLNTNLIKNFEIPIPDIKIQKEFSKVVLSIEEKIKNQNQQLQEQINFIEKLVYQSYFKEFNEILNSL